MIRFPDQLEVSISDPLATVSAATLAAGASAAATAMLTGGRDAWRDTRDRRRQHTVAVLEPLRQPQRLLGRAEVDRDADRWASTVLRTYSALDVAEPALPLGLRRLKRSLRDAVGTATGVALIDLFPGTDPVLTPYDRAWTPLTYDYVDLAVYEVQQWHDAWIGRQAMAVRLPTFDKWLSTGTAAGSVDS